MAEAVRQQSFHEIAPVVVPRRGDMPEPPPPRRPGWTPAHDDASLEAADERARAALQGVYDARTELGDVKAELAEIGAAVRSLVRVLKVLGALSSPVVIAVVVDLARDGVHWFATLHH